MYIGENQTQLCDISSYSCISKVYGNKYNIWKCVIIMTNFSKMCMHRGNSFTWRWRMRLFTTMRGHLVWTGNILCLVSWTRIQSDAHLSTNRSTKIQPWLRNKEISEVRTLYVNILFYFLKSKVIPASEVARFLFS